MMPGRFPRYGSGSSGRSEKLVFSKLIAIFAGVLEMEGRAVFHFV